MEAFYLYQKMGFTIREKKSGKMAGNEAFDITGYIMEYRKKN